MASHPPRQIDDDDDNDKEEEEEGDGGRCANGKKCNNKEEISYQGRLKTLCVLEIYGDTDYTKPEKFKYENK